MTTPEVRRDMGVLPEDPQAGMERTYIENYLAGKGIHLKDLKNMPEEVARQLLTEASIYASNKLAEVETRSKLVNELHGDF